jgi:HD-like signal output (HDOD) protein
MKKILVEKINSLPPLPNSIIELENFRKLENYDVDKLLTIINKDPLMVTTILRVANSSMFGFRSEIDTLSRAINLLGINFTISIAIGSSIQSTIDSNLLAYATTNDDFIFASSLATNIINTWISSVDFDLKNELLLPAFLQQIGKYVISDAIQESKLTEEFLQRLNECDNPSIVEVEFTGFTCSKITANIFKNWSFSHKIIFPIAFVDEIDKCPESFKKHAQILEIVKILSDIRKPLDEKNIELAVTKASSYGFDIEHLLNSIDVIKEVISQNS